MTNQQYFLAARPLGLPKKSDWQFRESLVPEPVLQGSSTVGGSCFVAGKLTKRGASVYVAVTGTQ